MSPASGSSSYSSKSGLGPAAALSLSGTQLSALPEALSYSPLALPTSNRTLVRRDLFDAHFQLLAQGRDEQAALVDAPADLVPGVYEGGLKTWECALDLAAYVEREVERVRGLRVLELGCGTAVPTLLLLDRLFTCLASESGQTGSASDVELPETEIHLQDYNRAVLELVTFPNVLLAWYVSPLSAPYLASASDADSDSDSDDRAAHERRPGALTVTPALQAAFRTSLDAHRVRLRFFSGGWSSLRAQLTPYDVVLASETIYRTDVLGPFLGVLRAATMGGGDTREAPLCLVAAKVLYFGVGGGVQEFVRAVEDEGGTVGVVWEHREGVGRRIMRVEW
ncbi:hypothetical protein EI94DRAFT_1780502 [Lactarius quietus]|nr:hypothetical protein EI94DRAFT_1780502 [Lactarius quietus]